MTVKLAKFPLRHWHKILIAWQHENNTRTPPLPHTHTRPGWYVSICVPRLSCKNHSKYNSVCHWPEIGHRWFGVWLWFHFKLRDEWAGARGIKFGGDNGGSNYNTQTYSLRSASRYPVKQIRGIEEHGGERSLVAEVEKKIVCKWYKINKYKYI